MRRWDKGARAAEGYLWFRFFGTVYRARRPFTITNNFRMYDDIYGGLAFPEKSDMIIRIDTVTANNTPISAGYDLVLVKNT